VGGQDSLFKLLVLLALVVLDAADQRGEALHLLYHCLLLMTLQSLNMASTMDNHSSGLCILKSGRWASQDDTAYAAAEAAACMASISNAGVSGLRAMLFSPLLAIKKIAENKNQSKQRKTQFSYA
jgi:hypothetical protein